MKGILYALLDGALSISNKMIILVANDITVLNQPLTCPGRIVETFELLMATRVMAEGFFE